MIRQAFILLFFPVLLHAQNVREIEVLFDSLRTHPATISDDIMIKQAIVAKKMAYSKLYPTIDVFGRYDFTSVATGMVPVPPNDLITMVKDPAVAQPFSENIYRLGATVSMPIFVASIFSTAARAQMMAHSAEDQRMINLIKNEAVIVSSNADMLYLQSLDRALEQKKSSLLKTREFVVIKVNNGRAPESALLNIDNAIHQVDILKNDLALQREDLITLIKSLTGITLTEPIPMEQIGTFQDGGIKALDPLREKVDADRLGLRSEKNKLLPALMLQGGYMNNFAKSYNNNQSVNNDFTNIGLTVRLPILAMDQYAQIKKSRLDYDASKNELDKMSLELSAQAEQLQKSLLLIENSIGLYENSIQEKEQLLAIAKVSYQSDQLSMEDYLKYEDDVVLEQSELFKAQAQKWQTLVKLNVIYGNNIEEVVK